MASFNGRKANIAVKHLCIASLWQSKYLNQKRDTAPFKQATVPNCSGQGTNFYWRIIRQHQCPFDLRELVIGQLLLWQLADSTRLLRKSPFFSITNEKKVQQRFKFQQKEKKNPYTKNADKSILQIYSTRTEELVEHDNVEGEGKQQLFVCKGNFIFFCCEGKVKQLLQ